jgi:hypothetical protein
MHFFFFLHVTSQKEFTSQHSQERGAFCNVLQMHWFTESFCTKASEGMIRMPGNKHPV